MKNKIMSYFFNITILLFFALNIFLPDNKISSFERRMLTQFPGFTSQFFTKMDSYVTDQFPLRNMWLSINAFFNRYMLGNKDNNNIYIENGIIYDKNYPLNNTSINGFIDKMNYINNKYLTNTNNFYSIIPDKAAYLPSDKYLKLDYNSLYNILNNSIDINYIDITNILNVDDYYKTDIHIKQESMLKIVKTLSEQMNFQYINFDFYRNVYHNFAGASYSKIGYSFKKEDLVYLTNDYMKDVVVKHLEYGIKDLYDLEMLNNVDKYNIFLSGPSALIEVSNNNINNNRELIIFRDSFASSIVPLLIPYYSKITLVDLRYLDESLIENYLTFNKQDVLLLYSTLIVNNSSILKIYNDKII